MAEWLLSERAAFDTDVLMSLFSIEREPIDVDEQNVLT